VTCTTGRLLLPAPTRTSNLLLPLLTVCDGLRTERLRDVAVQDLIKLGTPLEEWGPEGDRFEVRFLVRWVPSLSPLFKEVPAALLFRADSLSRCTQMARLRRPRRVSDPNFFSQVQEKKNRAELTRYAHVTSQRYVGAEAQPGRVATQLRRGPRQDRRRQTARVQLGRIARRSETPQ
jgi:hypothetical protein